MKTAMKNGTEHKAGKKAIVAMSGGVDSSVAAFLLKEEGYDVTGLSFELWDMRDLKKPDVCCSVETIELARSVAQRLGIEHQTVDVRDTFHEQVIESFCISYIDGLTPNPCILCNKYIKFDFLLKKAEELGADVIATGHYARVAKAQGTGHRTQSPEPGTQNTEYRTQNTDSGRFLLKKGVDTVKDQSYVLYVMTQQELSKTVFPLGGLRKEETRRIAGDIGLAGALRAESQEICFVGDGHYADFIKDFAPKALMPGDVLDSKGKVVGEHKGIAFYTIGQRKGLGVQSLRPSYVTDINPDDNTITIGDRKDAMGKSFKVKELNWISIEGLNQPIRAEVKVRSTMRGVPSTVSPDGEGVAVEFDEPQWAPAPGQSAVFYAGDVVIGGGIIKKKRIK
jgi:tRNA-specific 2-thiouridylase